MFVCKNCGQTYPMYSNFCTKCGGNAIEEVADAPVAGAMPVNQPVEPAYANPAADPAYNAPVGGPAYNAPAGGPAYNAPVGGPAYNAPTGGPAYNAPVSGPVYGGYAAPTTPADYSAAAKVKGIVGMSLSIAGAVFAFIAFCLMVDGFDSMGSYYGHYSANESGASGFVLALMFALPLGIVGGKFSGGAIENGFVSGISKTGKIVGLVAWICAAVIATLCIFPMSY